MGLGAEHNGDLMTSASLANLYMIFLAEEVAYDGGGNPVTDNKSLDNLSTYLRARNTKYERLVQATETVINISLPKRIENISIDEIIRFRNDSGISEMRQSFNHSLERFYSSIEGGLEPEDFVSSLQKTNLEFAKEVALCFTGVSAVTLGGLIIYSNPSMLEAIKLSVEGTTLAIGSTLGINKAWGDGKEKRNSRKFVNKLKTINRFSKSIY